MVAFWISDPVTIALPIMNKSPSITVSFPFIVITGTRKLEFHPHVSPNSGDTPGEDGFGVGLGGGVGLGSGVGLGVGCGVGLGVG